MSAQEPTLSAARALLGLAQGADRAEVVQAYRRLARQTHPDVSGAPGAAARFAAINAAYRRALAWAGAPAATAAEVPAPASSVPRGATNGHDDDYLRWVGVGTVDGTFEGAATAVVGAWRLSPPVVAGPVRVEPPRGGPGRSRTHETRS